MQSRQEMKLTLGAERFLVPGETVVRALVAVAKGPSHHIDGVPQTAAAPAGQAGEGAARRRVSLAPQVGLVLTTRRLLTLRISTSYGFGHGGDPQELLGAVPLADVDEIVVRRLLFRQTIAVTVGGESVRLDANSLACGRELAEALVRARDEAHAAGEAAGPGAPPP
jgi:hypothetical protein